MLKKILVIISILISVPTCFSFSSVQKVDSINNLAWQSMSDDFSKVLYYSDLADSISTVIDYKSGKGYAAIYKGWVNFYQSNFTEAFQLYAIAYNIGVNEKNNHLLGRYYLSIGSYYTKIGDLDLGLEKYQKGLELLIKEGDKEWETYAYNNIGVNYSNLEDNKNARYYYQKALNLFKSRNDSIGVTLSYSNIATCYQNESLLDSAIYFSKLALGYAEKLNHTIIIGSSQLVLSELYLKKKNNLFADKYLQNAKTLYNNINDIDGIIDVAFLESDILRTQNTNKAIAVLKAISLTVDTMDILQNKVRINQKLANLYIDKSDFKNAYHALNKHIEFNNAMINQTSFKNINELEVKYQVNEKILEIENLNNRNELIQVNLDKKKLEEIHQRKTKYWILFISLTIATLLSVLLFIIFRNNKKTIKANLIISQQKEDVELKNVIIEQKSHEIFDSITYAKRIQNAILPKASDIGSYFPNSFLIYLPKDIVAGDFYWFEKINNIRFFAIADCTGHGVPGAMVSVVCHNALNAAVYEHNLIKPGEILDKVKNIIFHAFSNDHHQIKDGMDISLGVINDTTNVFTWAGANNPLWQTSKAGELTIYKPDKQPIGDFEKSSPFNTHYIHYKPGDKFYLFSDGYIDQFGGLKNKKYKTVNFKKLILSNVKHSFEIQKRNINQEFYVWKNDQEQLDDVCIFGFEI